jgi:hypothetical protein
MAPNMALKRAIKANRRKALVAEKRKLELVTGSPAARMLGAAQAPIRHCLMTEEIFNCGMGTVVLARGATPYELTVGGFLIDAWQLGVKDTYFKCISGETFEDLIGRVGAPMASVDPRFARKLLRDAVAWAASNGIAPHRDFAVVEKLFGDVDANACDATFEFGRDGKPAYIVGPNELPAKIRLRVGALREVIATELGKTLALENQE